jgi:hypothetical protein
MESMWSVAFAAVMVIGVGAATLGGIVLEHLLPTYFGKRTDGKLEPPVQREVADLRKELEASRRKIDRLETLEDHVGRVQERVDFLERLVRGEPEHEIGKP